MGLQETTYITIDTIAFVITFVSIVMMFSLLSSNIFKSILYGSALVRAAIIGGGISTTHLKPKDYFYSFYASIDDPVASFSAPAKNIFGLEIKRNPAWVGYPLEINDPKRVFIIYDEDLSSCIYDLISCIRGEKKDCIDYKECFELNNCKKGTVISLNTIFDKYGLYDNYIPIFTSNNGIIIQSTKKLNEYMIVPGYCYYETKNRKCSNSDCVLVKKIKEEILKQYLHLSESIINTICTYHSIVSHTYECCFFKETQNNNQNDNEKNNMKKGWISGFKNVLGIVGLNYYNNEIPNQEIKEKLKLKRGEVLGICVASIQ